MRRVRRTRHPLRARAARRIPADRLDQGKISSLGGIRLADEADEEVDMPGSNRSMAGPVNKAPANKAAANKAALSNERLVGLIEPVVAAVGMDLESVRVSVAGRRRLVRVVVDSDHGVSLDDAADVSREVSAALDAADALGEMPYTLEVSSPGVDRPLTTPSHWRRATGRLVRIPVTGKKRPVEGRVVTADSDGVTLDVAGQQRLFRYAELGGPGAIQIEFGRVADAELAEFSDPEPDDKSDLETTVFDNDPVVEDDTDLGAGGDGY
jgi:ribosome maturation factor RimP